VEEPALVDEPQDLCLLDRFLRPVFWPIVKDMLCDVASRVAGTEQVLLSLATDQDQPQVDLITGNASTRHDIIKQMK